MRRACLYSAALCAGLCSAAVVAADTTLVVSEGQFQNSQAIENAQGSVRVTARDGVAWDAPVTGIQISEPDCVWLDKTVEVDLGAYSNSTGIGLNNGTLDIYGAAISVEAATALSGEGNLFISRGDMMEHSTLNLQGRVDFSKGSIQADLTDITLSSRADIGALVLYDGAGLGTSILDAAGQTESCAEVHLGELSLAGGTVSVDGYVSSDAMRRDYGARVIVEKLAAEMENGRPVDAGAITVRGNGTLVLGRDMTARDLNTVLGRSALSAGLMQAATLVTTYDFRTPAGNVAFVIGQGTQQHPVSVGDDGQWIIDMRQASVSQQSTLLDVAGTQNAHLVVYGWDGTTQPLVTASGDWSEENAVLSGSSVRGTVHLQNGRVQIERVYCKDFRGLAARELVAEVEDRYAADTPEARPGYRFIQDSFSEQRVGNDAYADTIDAAVFLPMSSGIAAAVQRSGEEAGHSVLAHPFDWERRQSHWWAQAQAGRHDLPHYAARERGHWGVSADSATVAMGFDKRWSEHYATTLAISGVTVDAHNTGDLVSSSSDATLAQVSAVLRRRDEGRLWQLMARVGQAQMHAAQLINEHRLEADPELFEAALQSRWSWSGQGHWQPSLTLGVHHAKLSALDVTDSTDTLTGTGFELQADARTWLSAQLGADWTNSWTVYEDYTVSPALSVQLAGHAGKRGWDVQAALPDGAGRTHSDFADVPAVRVRCAASLALAHSGMQPVAKPWIWTWGGDQAEGGKSAEPEIEPFAWELTVQAGYERASHAESSSQMGLHYRAIF